MLGLASSFRPTSVAAVYALLARGRSPSRLLAVYILAGLAFTISFGVLVIVVFGGIRLHAGSSRTKAIAEIAAGVLAVAFGLAVLSGRIGARGRAGDAPPAPNRFERALERHVSTRGAAVAGPITHLPGVFYIFALDLIVASQRHLALGVADVLLYNAAWFALPLAAFAVCIVDPSRARRAVGAVQGWTAEHSRAIILTVTLAGGPALIVAGLLTI